MYGYKPVGAAKQSSWKDAVSSAEGIRQGSVYITIYVYDTIYVI